MDPSICNVNADRVYVQKEHVKCATRSTNNYGKNAREEKKKQKKNQELKD